MCMFAEAQSAPCKSLGAAWRVQACKYHFPPSMNVTHRAVPRASGPSRLEFRPLTFRVDMVTCRLGGPPGGVTDGTRVVVSSPTCRWTLTSAGMSDHAAG
jgi:hypothetical protein